MESDKKSLVLGGYLEQYGEILIDNGYNIVPIEPGKKAPGFDDWQKTKSNKATLEKWLKSGRGIHGVGVITKETPAVDIDVLDDELAELLERWCIKHLGAAPIRVGMAPKRLLLYKAETPFRKITSKTYVNEWQERCRIEILGDGQQFVAFHKHPDTHRPYKWTTDATPLNTPADDLPVLDQEKVLELIELFETEAEKRGWTMTKSSRLGKGLTPQTGKIDRNDPFAADTQPIDMKPAELQSRLMMTPGAEDYDVWLQVGMALYHQFDGEELGREMWHEWSEQAENYDQDALNRKWDTFDIGNKGRAPVTARLILQLAKEASETAAIEIAQDLRNRFAQALDRSEWNDVAKDARRAEVDHLSRAGIAEVARDRLQVITSSKVPLAEVKKSLAYEINTKELPRWCRDWVYDVSEDKFYHLVSKYGVTAQGFNALNDRHSVTKKDVLEGKTAPAANASMLALNVYKIPGVNGRMYAPGRDSIFLYNEVMMANTYPENMVPAKPKAIRPLDKVNIKRVKAHLAHLLPDEKKRRYFMDWLAYVVQNPGKRVNYAPLLQGVQGDGKSFWAFFLGAVMGGPNVRHANAHILEGAFTGWAQGQCVMAIEEIRLVGHNRYDVLNRVKPFITNPIVEIHPKGRDPFNVENTTNYLLFTNYRDAMPLSENERRFLVLFSQWQSSADLRRFKEESPDYYVDLYGALEESASALRYWILQHEISSEFNEKGDAPITDDFHYMVKASQQPDMKVIRELIDSGEYPDISDELLNVTFMQSLAMSSDMEIPQAKGLEKLLENAGFSSLGRVQIGDAKSRFYSKNPTHFQSMIKGELQTDSGKIRRYLKENAIDDDDEL